MVYVRLKSLYDSVMGGTIGNNHKLHAMMPASRSWSAVLLGIDMTIHLVMHIKVQKGIHTNQASTVGIWDSIHAAMIRSA
jgi:hypothetical protein